MWWLLAKVRVLIFIDDLPLLPTMSWIEDYADLYLAELQHLKHIHEIWHKMLEHEVVNTAIKYRRTPVRDN